MARKYKVEVTRDSITAKMFVHDDKILEIVDPDSGVQQEYLIRKLVLVKELFEICESYNLDGFEIKKI